MTGLFDLVMAPFAGRPGLALAVVSALAGVAMIFIFRAVSDQAKIRRTRDLLKARILEMRIYQDDVVLILKALGAAIATNFTYLRVTWKPIVLLVAFVAIVFVQLDARFGRAPLSPGETVTVTAVLVGDPGAATLPVSLVIEGGAAVDAPPVRVPSRSEVSWRVRATSSERAEARLSVGAQVFEFTLATTPGTRVIGHARSTSWWDALLHPGWPSLPSDSAIRSVSVTYPEARPSLLGWRTHWLVAFVVWSMIGALVPKMLFGIEV